MAFKFRRRTRSLSTPQLEMKNNHSSEILLYVLPNEEKVEVLTSHQNSSSSDFLCCLDSCDLNSISSAFWIFLGYESEDDEEDVDAPQVIQTGLYLDKKSSLESLNGLPLLSSSSTSSMNMDEIKITKSITRSRSSFSLVQMLSKPLSKNRKDEAKTEECSRSEDELDDDTHPLQFSYMDELPALSYIVEDDGDFGVGIIPRSSVRAARYRLAALDAATQRDFCALHELFFQSLFEEAKSRRLCTKTRPDESLSRVVHGSNSFDDPPIPLDIMDNLSIDDNTFISSVEVDRQKTMLQMTPTNKIRRFCSESLNGSVRYSKGLKNSWYRLRNRGLSHRNDLIIAPTSDFYLQGETSYAPEPSTSSWFSSDNSQPSAEVISPLFVHANCRLQKDKYKGVKIGSQLSAYGRDAVLRKLNEKIDHIAAIDLKNSRASLTQVEATRAPLASIRTSVISDDYKKDEWNIDPDEAFQWEKKDVVETRSMIGINMGLLSIQYGLLIQWDVKTCTTDLIALRKMCSDDFLSKSHRLNKNMVESTSLRQKVHESDNCVTVDASKENAAFDAKSKKLDSMTTSASISKEHAEPSILKTSLSPDNDIPALPPLLKQQSRTDDSLLQGISFQVCVVSLEESTDSGEMRRVLNKPYVKLSTIDEVYVTTVLDDETKLGWPTEFFTFHNNNRMEDLIEKGGLTIEVYDQRTIEEDRLIYSLIVPSSLLSNLSLNSNHLRDNIQDKRSSQTEICLPCKVLSGDIDEKVTRSASVIMNLTFLKE